MNLIKLTNDISTSFNDFFSSVLDSNLASEIKVGLGEKATACHEAAKTIFQEVMTSYDTASVEKMNVAIFAGSLVGLILFLKIHRLSQKVDTLEKKQSQNEITQNYLKQCNLAQRDVIDKILPTLDQLTGRFSLMARVNKSNAITHASFFRENSEKILTLERMHLADRIQVLERMFISVQAA